MTTLKVGQQIRVKVDVPVELFKVFSCACPDTGQWFSRHECSKYSFLGKIVTITAINPDGWVRIKLKSAQIIVREEWLEPVNKFRFGEYIQSKVTGQCYVLGEGTYVHNDELIVPEKVLCSLVNKISKCKYNNWKANQTIHNQSKTSLPAIEEEPNMRPIYGDCGGWTVKQDEPKNWIVLDSTGNWWGIYTSNKATEQAKEMSKKSPNSTYYVGQIRDMVKTVTETKTTVSPYKPFGE